MGLRMVNPPLKRFVHAFEVLGHGRVVQEEPERGDLETTRGRVAPTGPDGMLNQARYQ